MRATSKRKQEVVWKHPLAMEDLHKAYSEQSHAMDRNKNLLNEKQESHSSLFNNTHSDGFMLRYETERGQVRKCNIMAIYDNHSW